MTREDIQKEIISLNGDNWLLELATGTGKSKIALEKIKSIQKNKTQGTLLIVVPRNVHKENWRKEIHKWWKNCPLDIHFTTYVSFPKYVNNWNYVIFDECHHLTERCISYLKSFNIEHSILLSATIGTKLKINFAKLFSNLVIYKKDLRNIIDENILPDPTVYLWELNLDIKLPTESIWKNKKAKGKLIECNWVSRWNYIKQKTSPVRVYCTERQYYIDLESQIEYWRKRYLATRGEISKNKWLKLCSDRLKWLSDKKLRHLMQLLPLLKNNRTLTFCNSIEQTELLGKYCINSKNISSIHNLYLFNIGKINHITACNMLNEGMNLINCQIGIYANLNSSETIIKQRMGRLLRHPNPIIIVPYYKDTREEELVKKMLENYNPDLVNKISNINEIKI